MNHSDKERGLTRDLGVLRVGDGILCREGGGWVSQGYYQYDEIVDAFARAGRSIDLSGFGRILELNGKRTFALDPQKIRPCGVRVSGRGVLPLLSKAGTIVTALRREMARCDVVWAMLPSMLGLFAVEVASRWKPCITQLVGDPEESIARRSSDFKDAAASWLGARLVRRAVAKADGAIFVSEALKRKYLPGSQPRWLVANESRIPGDEVLSAVEIDAGNDKAATLIYVGRLTGEKGVDVLLRALAQLPQVCLRIVGDGPLRPHLEKLARRLAIETRVHFAGWQPWNREFLKRIRGHLALVLPSYTEGLGLVLLEAMSQGVPVVGSAVGGVPEIVQHEVTGLLVPPGNVEALAGAIERLRCSLELRQRLAAAALQVARSHTAEAEYGKMVDFMLATVTRKCN